MSSSKISRFWFHPYMWTTCFFCWYQFFCSTFLGLINCSWYVLILLLIPFLVIWFLSVTSLYRCLYTRPPLIPQIYSIPQNYFNSLNQQEKQDKQFCASNTSLPGGLSPASGFESGLENKAANQECNPWEKFYRRVTKLAMERSLNSGTTPMVFGNDTIQCPNICMNCFVVKPDRVHHCRRCGRCIMRMDHHCPVIGKCVHLGNHKFFLLFLAYSTLLCIYIFLSMLPLLISVSIRFYTMYPPKEDGQHRDFLIPFVFSAIGCCAAFGTPFYLIWFQWSLWKDLLKNQTILEDLAVETGHTAVSTNKYNLGSRRKNMESIFGKRKWCWFLPFHSTEISV